MKAYGNLITPDFFSGKTGVGIWNQVDGLSLDLLKKIELQMCRLAPENEYGYRHLWMEVPRGDISQWCTREEWDGFCDGSSDADGDEYEKQWKFDFPLETMWFVIEYPDDLNDDFHSIHIRDKRDYCCTIISRDDGDSINIDLSPFLSKLLSGITELIDDICLDTGKYNEYIEAHLPKQYRYGRISRRDLDRVAPFCRLDIKESDLAKTVLRKIVGKEFTPIKGLTIRQYLKYYHIAASSFRKSLREGIVKQTESDEMDDIKFYSIQHGSRFDGLDLDDPDDLDKIKYDHYGEIDLTRLDILADDYVHDGTLIRVDCSYASLIDHAVNVAVALYKSGAPLDMDNAETMLAAVEGTDEIRIRPNTYHDYIGADCDGCGGSIEIPFEYELEGLNWDEESLNEVIRVSKWDKLDEVKPNGE